MTQIDPARISRIFRTLSASAGSQSNYDGSSKSEIGPKGKDLRSPALLQASIKTRLVGLNQEELRTAGPVITIQEVLRWEFGDEVLNNADFSAVTEKVVSAMLADEQLAPALQRLVFSLAG